MAKSPKIWGMYSREKGMMYTAPTAQDLYMKSDLKTSTKGKLSLIQAVKRSHSRSENRVLIFQYVHEPISYSAPTITFYPLSRSGDEYERISWNGSTIDAYTDVIDLDYADLFPHQLYTQKELLKEAFDELGLIAKGLLDHRDEPYRHEESKYIETSQKPMEQEESIEMEVKQEPIKAVKKSKAKSGGNPMELMQQAFSMMGGGLDEAQVEKIVERKMAEKPQPMVVEVVHKSITTKVEKAHKNFDKLMRMMGTKSNIALIGEAGTGKTFAAQDAARCLNLQHYTMSFHAKMTSTDLRGYCDANGNYHASPIYTAFKEGGVLILDEFDRANTEVVVSLNNLLSGQSYLFPNGENVTKSEDFYVIACQNTTGNGGSKAYASAKRQDGATLNRFMKLDWDTDEALEIAIAGDTNATQAVQKIRKNARELMMTEIIISPRQSIDANKLVCAGFTLDEAIHHTITMGLGDDQVKRLLNGVAL